MTPHLGFGLDGVDIEGNFCIQEKCGGVGGEENKVR